MKKHKWKECWVNDYNVVQKCEVCGVEVMGPPYRVESQDPGNMTEFEYYDEHTDCDKELIFKIMDS